MQIAILDRHKDDVTWMQQKLQDSSYNIEIHSFRSFSSLKKFLALNHCDLIIIDHSKFLIESLRIVQYTQVAYPLLPVFVFSSQLTPTLSKSLIQHGAAELMDKANHDFFLLVVDRILTKQDRLMSLQKQHTALSQFNKLIANNLNSALLILDNQYQIIYQNDVSIQKFQQEDATRIDQIFHFISKDNILQIFQQLQQTTNEVTHEKSRSITHDPVARTLPAFVKTTLFDEENDSYYQLKIVSNHALNADLRIAIIADDISHDLREQLISRRNRDELSQLIYRIYHDIKGPIATSQGLAKLLQLEPNKVVTYAELLDTTLEKLKVSVSRLLTTAQLPYSKITLIETSLYKLINATIVSFDQNIHNEHLTIENLVDQDVNVTTDFRLLSIATHNVLQNAIIHNTTERKENAITIHYTKSSHAWSIIIKDTGAGIAMTEINRMFQPFTKTNALHDGPGLGLYIVKQCAERLRGSVKIHSEANIGTIVTMTFPLSKSKYEQISK